jgi:hypothetical protein
MSVGVNGNAHDDQSGSSNGVERGRETKGRWTPGSETAALLERYNPLPSSTSHKTVEGKSFKQGPKWLASIPPG